MTYFKNVETLEELRKQYKELLKKFHPDNPNGSTEATQAINAEYDKLFKVLKDRHESKATADSENGKADFNKKYYDFAEDKALREMLNKIIGFNGVKIEIIGNWIWCFDSYGYRKELKELGFKYAGQKKLGTIIRKHSEKKDVKRYQWTIYEIITEVQKLRQKKRNF